MKKVEILGTDMARCQQLAQVLEEAAKTLEIEIEITQVNQLDDIKKYEIAITPALLVDGEVKSVGTVPSLEEVQVFLK